MIINNVQMQNLYVVQENLNVRSGPGTQYCKIGIIPKGKTVKVLKQENNWFKVKYKNKVFWLSGQYLG